MNAVFRTGVRPSGDTQELVIARETYRVLDITETGVRGQCGVSIAPTGAAMVYAKAFAVGLVTGVLAPVVVAVVEQVVLPLVGFAYLFVSCSVVGGPSCYDSFSSVVITPEIILRQMVVGFAIGFLFTLWRALVTKHGPR